MCFYRRNKIFICFQFENILIAILSLPENKKPERPKRVRSKAVIIKPAEGVSYAAILKNLKNRVNLEELGVTIRGISWTRRKDHLCEGIKVEILDIDPAKKISEVQEILRSCSIRRQHRSWWSLWRGGLSEVQGRPSSNWRNRVPWSCSKWLTSRLGARKKMKCLLLLTAVSCRLVNCDW